MSVKVTKDELANVLKSIHALVSREVLIGIPESEDARKASEDGEPIGNAEIGYIQETGSPTNNLPARPFLVPGVEKALPQAVAQLERGGKRALSGDRMAGDASLHAAGLTCQNSVKAVINSNIAPALSPETIKNRFRQRGTKGRRKGEKAYLDMIGAGAQSGGMSLYQIQSVSGIVSLINTGQLRNSITHVIRDK